MTFLRVSGWTCWPERGGWAEQDAFLIEDVLIYLQVELRARWEAEHGDIMQSVGMDRFPHLTL